MNNTTRTIPIIEVYDNGEFVGRFVNMNSTNPFTKDRKGLSYRFLTLSEKNKDFWTLIRKGYVLQKSR